MAVDVERMYRAYGPMVLRRCRRLLRDQEKSLDAMHDVFVEILRREQRLEDRGLASLLLQTATHVCLNRLRSERRHPEDRDDALLLAIAAEADGGPEHGVAVQRIFQRLFHDAVPSTRVMAVLHHVDGLTLEQVASEVGLSVSGVRKRLRGLKERLAQLEEQRDG